MRGSIPAPVALSLVALLVSAPNHRAWWQWVMGSQPAPVGTSASLGEANGRGRTVAFLPRFAVKEKAVAQGVVEGGKEGLGPSLLAAAAVAARTHAIVKRELACFHTKVREVSCSGRCWEQP